MHHILTDLNAGDTFNIIRFSSTTHRLGTMHYTKTSVRKAKKYMHNLSADGGTDIDGGLKVGFKIFTLIIMEMRDVAFFVFILILL